MNYPSKLDAFLTEHAFDPWGTWCGRMTANEQLALFGRVIGRGKIVINGEQETICNRVKVCFGHDYDDRNITPWSAL